MKKPTGPTLFEIPDEPEDDEPRYGGTPTLQVARAIGEVETARVGAKAERVDPGFLRSARAAMLVELQNGPRTGEQLADACKAQGIKPHDDRAFGSVIRELSRDKVIEAVGFAPRSKGHGTAGGRVWSLKR